MMQVCGEGGQKGFKGSVGLENPSPSWVAHI